MTRSKALDLLTGSPGDLVQITGEAVQQLVDAGANGESHDGNPCNCRRVLAIGQAVCFALQEWIGLAGDTWAAELPDIGEASPTARGEGYSPKDLWVHVSAAVAAIHAVNDTNPPETRKQFADVWNIAISAHVEIYHWLELVGDRLARFGIETPKPGAEPGAGHFVGEVLSILRSAVDTLEGLQKGPATPDKLDAIARIVADSTRGTLETWGAQQEADEYKVKH